MRHRLLNLAKSRGEELQAILTRYGVERLLYRLAHSYAKNRFVLKRAMLFHIWEGGARRPTRDVDFLGYGDTSAEGMIREHRRHSQFSRSRTAVGCAEPSDALLAKSLGTRWQRFG